MSTDTEIKYYVAFSHIRGVGPQTFQHLMKKFRSAENAYHATMSEIRSVVKNKKTCKNISEFRTSVTAERVYKNVIKKGIQIIYQRLPNWPKQLSSIPDPPICLYTKGNAKLLSRYNHTLAIVGSRKPTQYGREQAELFSKKLSQRNMIILSGLALGIDAYAQKIAVLHSFPTISVLGSGFEHFHPQQNLGLCKKILDTHGLIITEFPPHIPPRPGNFPVRNRIIAALAKGLLIMEGNAQSGTLTTGAHAIQQGKDVFALPGPVTSPLSAAPHRLIQQGAHLVTSPEYIATYYDLKHIPNSQNSEELNIMKHLHNPQTIQQLCVSLNLSYERVQPMLSHLELDGVVTRHANNTYSIV